MTTVLVSRLEEKFQLLLKKMQRLQEENQRLQTLAGEREKRLQQEDDTIRELKHQIALLKIASDGDKNGQGSQGSSDARKALRSTINKYIREIDYCIAQLNE